MENPKHRVICPKAEARTGKKAGTDFGPSFTISLGTWRRSLYHHYRGLGDQGVRGFAKLVSCFLKRLGWLLLFACIMRDYILHARCSEQYVSKGKGRTNFSLPVLIF